MDFPKIFKNARVITLEENYRSTQCILDMTNEVIRYAKEKFEKNLFTRKNSGRQPVFVDAKDEFSQSRYIVDKILELREDGVELNDIAVLFRSGWHSNDLEVELASRGIPFVKYGGQKFVEAAHIKDMLSYLRIVYNPHDQISWWRALLLVRGIGPKTAEKIIRQIIAGSGNAAIDESIARKSPGVKVLLELVASADPAKQSPEEIIDIFLKYYNPLLKEKYDDFNKRLNDLDSLRRIACRYDNVETFLADMALDPPERSIIEAGTKDKDDPHLVLSTIHSAKGLEWHTVFVIYVAEGHLPSYLSLENDEAVEEERRLFYVAVTRARENLYLLKPHLDRSPRVFFDGGGTVFTSVSRFLEEGDILGRLVEVETAYEADSEEVEAGKETARKPDKDFLDLLREYYRDE